MFGILALRGSKVKPDDLPKSLNDVAVAEEILEDTTTELSRAYQTVYGLERVSQQYQNAELTSLVDDLKANLRELENKEKQAKQNKLAATSKYSSTLRQFAAGGIAGAFARTCVAPIDRVKILMQTQYVNLPPGAEPKYTSNVQCLKHIVANEGVGKLWRGNLTNLIRVVPYSATQFASYDFYKKFALSFGDQENGGNLTFPQRLFAGAAAGTTATTVTHPLDVCRLRLAVQPELKGTRDAIRSVWMENGFRSMYKGYFPTCLSLGPFIAVNFATFDTLKMWYYPNPDDKRNPVMVLLLGAAAGIFAQTCCYPLDTVRRRMQMKGTIYTSTPNAFATILAKEGLRGFYKGMSANAIKVIPNNALRFLAYDFIKTYLGVAESRRR